MNEEQVQEKADEFGKDFTKRVFERAESENIPSECYGVIFGVMFATIGNRGNIGNKSFMNGLKRMIDIIYDEFCNTLECLENEMREETDEK